MAPPRGADQASGRDTNPSPTLAQTMNSLRRYSDDAYEDPTKFTAKAASLPLPAGPAVSPESTGVLAKPTYETVRDSNGNEKKRLALPYLSGVDTTTTMATDDPFVSPVDSENSEDGIIIFRGSDRVDPTVNHGGKTYTVENTDTEPRFASRLHVHPVPSKPTATHLSNNGVSAVDFQPSKHISDASSFTAKGAAFIGTDASSTARDGLRSPSITELPYPAPYVHTPAPRRAPREQFDIEAQTAGANEDFENFRKAFGFVFCNPRPMSTRGKKFYNVYNIVMWLLVLVFVISVLAGIGQGSIVLK